MGTLISFATWIAAHWVEIGVAIGYGIAAARIIVKLTPTPADDTALAWVINVLRHLGLQLEPVTPEPVDPNAPVPERRGLFRRIKDLLS